MKIERALSVMTTKDKMKKKTVLEVAQRVKGKGLSQSILSCGRYLDSENEWLNDMWIDAYDKLFYIDEILEAALENEE